MSHYLKLRKSIFNNYASKKDYLVHFEKPMVVFGAVLNCSIKGLIDIFSRRAIGFHRQSKHFEHFLQETFSLEVQTRQIKFYPQPVNLPGS